MRGSFTRREVLIGMGAAGMTPLLINGCSDGGSAGEPLPDRVEYEWDGALGSKTLFEHGVASGDPLSDGVIIWTRVSPENVDADLPEAVFWEMALDEDFQQQTAAGRVETDAARDFTVKIDVSGLKWGRNYYYRFALQGRWSPTGRTRLAPKADEASQLRFGVCACSSYARGWFHAYRHMASRSDLDAVLHLGDYFYEYGDGEFDEALGPVYRLVEPPHETVTLEDYRLRFSQHRRDRDCQECHRQHPFIVVWDDHESANNSWMGGAENHDDDEGPWDVRLAAARQAFFEWIPIRETATRRLYRTLKYGELADIIMLDTRIEGREKQVSVAPSIPYCDLTNPTQPTQMLGPEQEAWLFGKLSESVAKWRIVGNQVVLSMWQTSRPLQYFNEDQWHCYPAARERLVGFLREQDIPNVVVATGDVHTSWAMDVTVGDGSYRPETREGAVAVEFVTPGITAPNPFPVSALEDAISANSHVRYAELTRSGYLVLDVQADKVQSDWYLLDGVNENEGNETLDASWAVLDGQKHVVEMDGPEMPNGGTPPPAS